MMNLDWFKNEDNISYVEADQFLANFEKETGISNLKEKITEFMKDPTPEGLQLTGVKRTAVTVFVPDVTFNEHIEMGENPWIYMGESYEAYCIYGL